MKKLKMLRIASRLDGVTSVFLDNILDQWLPFALTLERPWLNNAKGISCIPAGTYICKRVDSPKFGNTFEVTGVPNRDAILLHKGNIDDDSHGCILVGEQFSVWQDNSCSISASDAGFKEFLARTVAINEFELEIREVW